MTIFEGKVKIYNEAKCFGFISYEKGDIFFYSKNPYKKGESILFEESKNQKGLAATNLRRPKPPVEDKVFSLGFSRLNKKFYKKETFYTVSPKKVEILSKEDAPVDIVKHFEERRAEELKNLWFGRKNGVCIVINETPLYTTFKFEKGMCIFKHTPLKRVWGMENNRGNYWNFYRKEVESGCHLSGNANDYFEIFIAVKSEEMKMTSYTTTEVDDMEDTFIDRGWSTRTLTRTVTREAMAKIVVKSYSFTPKSGYEFLGTHVVDFTTTTFLN